MSRVSWVHTRRIFLDFTTSRLVIRIQKWRRILKKKEKHKHWLNTFIYVYDIKTGTYGGQVLRYPLMGRAYVRTESSRQNRCFDIILDMLLNNEQICCWTMNRNRRRTSVGLLTTANKNYFMNIFLKHCRRFLPDNQKRWKKNKKKINTHAHTHTHFSSVARHWRFCNFVQRNFRTYLGWLCMYCTFCTAFKIIPV